MLIIREGFLDGSVVKNLPTNVKDLSWIPGLERSLGEGNGNPLNSCLHNPMGAAKSHTQLSMYMSLHMCVGRGYMRNLCAFLLVYCELKTALKSKV